jgi:hypothetical protein
MQRVMESEYDFYTCINMEQWNPSKSF